MEIFNEGMAVPNIAKIDDFKDYFELVGFKDIEFWDKTEAILHSASRIYNLCKFTYPLRRILRIFKQNSRTLEILDKNNRAGIVQHDMVKSGLGTYGVFYAEKP